MSKPEYPSDKLDQYMVRFPDGMRDTLKEAASQNGRSMNSEIVHRLEQSFLHPVEQIWRQDFPDEPLSPASTAHLNDKFRVMARDWHRENEELDVEFLERDQAYLIKIIGVLAGQDDVSEEEAASLGRGAALRRYWLPDGAPISNPFSPQDPRHQRFADGFDDESEELLRSTGPSDAP